MALGYRPPRSTRPEGIAVRRAASTVARLTATVLVVLACVACSGAAPSDPAAADAGGATAGPLWTAPPSGIPAQPTATPVASSTSAPDAASDIALSGKYRLVYRPGDPGLADSLTSGLLTAGIKPRAGAREVWDATRQVGGMVVVELVGMELPDDALTTFATAFAERAAAEVTWTTVGDRRVAVVSDGEQRLELFLIRGDLVVVAGIDPALSDDIARELIVANA
jgi:hypothetical protein